MMDLSGRRFGRLVVVKEADRLPTSRGRRWLSVCDCGKEVVSPQRNLRCGKTQSCGCIQREAAARQGYIIGKAKITHGMTGTPEHDAWHHMRQRCTDPNYRAYPDYGGRGIKIDPRWETFEGFFNSMGRRPGRDYSLDRIDVNGPYSPENCRWADHKTQQRNRRWHRMMTYRGETKCVGEWAEIAGIPLVRFWARLFTGKWDMERAMTEPVQKRVRRKSKTDSIS